MQARSKKYILVSGNWPRKNAFLSYLPTYSNVYKNIYLLFLKTLSQTHRHKQKSKKTIANTQTEIKKQKKLTKKRDIPKKPTKKKDIQKKPKNKMRKKMLLL